MTTTTAAAMTNAHGFPVEPCYRCDGTGYLAGFSHVEGGVCFRCGGAKVSVVRAAAKAWEAYTAAIPRKQVVVAALRPGMRVPAGLGHLKKAGVPWVTVTAVGVTPERCGSSLTGTDETKRVHHYRLVVTTDDGASRVVAENSLVRRAISADMIPDPADYWPGATRR